MKIARRCWIGSRARGSPVLHEVSSLADVATLNPQVRGIWRDYVDIHTLVSHGIDVPSGPAAARAIERDFDPVMSIRALQSFGDGTLHRVPAGMQRDLTRWAEAVDLTKLPVLGYRRGLGPGGIER